MKNIVFISSRYPLPIVRGDQLILFNRIVEFHKLNYNVKLIVLSNRIDIDHDSICQIEKYCQVDFVPPKLVDYLMAVLEFVINKIPFQVAIFPQNLSLLKYKNADSYDIAYSFLSRTGLALFSINSKIKVCEFIDSLGKNFNERFKRSRGLAKLIYKFESARMIKYEKKLADSINLSITVSENDAIEISKSANMLVIPNGVDLEKFTINKVRDNNLLIFSGNLGYLPNKEAVVWFIPVYKEIRRINPNIKLKIVGSDPYNLKDKYPNIDGLSFTGYVEDLGAEISAGSISIAPIFTATGIQNKVLEALACGLTVVATSKVCEPLDNNVSKIILKADTAEQFVEHIHNVVKNNLFFDAQFTRKLVSDTYCWRNGALKIHSKIEGILKS